MEIKYYVDENGFKRVVFDPDELPEFTEDVNELMKPAKFKELTKRFLGILFQHTVKKDLQR